MVARAIGPRAQAGFERLIARTPSGRKEFLEPDEFPWIADVEARADEIREELDGLLARVDQLPNFQDIQEQRELTQDDRWKVFVFYGYGARVDSNCRQCPRTAEIVESIWHDHGDVLRAPSAQAHPASHRTMEGSPALSPRTAYASR